MGSILVGIAVALVVGAYIAQPFRVASEEVVTDPDRAIEFWVSRVRAEGWEGREERSRTGRRNRRAREAEPVNYCPHCGRRVGPGDRFCPGCGTKLR